MAIKMRVKRKHLYVCLCFVVIFGTVVPIIYLCMMNVENLEEHNSKVKKKVNGISFSDNQRRKFINKNLRATVNNASLSNLTGTDENNSHLDLNLNYKLHAFYYAWYGSPEIDGTWLHWNHRYIKYWKESEAKLWPSGMRHQPPHDIGASFYPKLGPYSSNSRLVIEEHMQQLTLAGVGVISLSWYPPGQADEEGKPASQLTPVILEIAEKHHIKVCFHVEPFQDRNAITLSEAIKFVIDHYGSHPAIYRTQRTSSSKTLPVFYMYDSYQVPVGEWKKLLTPRGDVSVRQTRYDAVFIGLLVEAKHKQDLVQGGFDGFYTYFSSDVFTYGSASRNWQVLGTFAKEHNLLFSPSVGPGYDDTRIRPWNSGNTKQRQHGLYYKKMFADALKSMPTFISITSFNEWGEGTQIEEAVPKTHNKHKYGDYSPESPSYYLRLTKLYSNLIK